MARKMSREARVKSILCQAMARNGMYDQKELCPLLNKSEGQISRMINGKTQITLLTLWSLDGILKFTDEEWLKLRCK